MSWYCLQQQYVSKSIILKSLWSISTRTFDQKVYFSKIGKFLQKSEHDLFSVIRRMSNVWHNYGVVPNFEHSVSCLFGFFLTWISSSFHATAHVKKCEFRPHVFGTLGEADNGWATGTAPGVDSADGGAAAPDPAAAAAAEASSWGEASLDAADAATEGLGAEVDVLLDWSEVETAGVVALVAEVVVAVDAGFAALAPPVAAAAGVAEGNLPAKSYGVMWWMTKAITFQAIECKINRSSDCSIGLPPNKPSTKSVLPLFFFCVPLLANCCLMVSQCFL